MTTATTGTGTVTLGSAVTKFRSFAEASVPNASVVSYLIEDGNDYELGYGVYTSAGTTMTRAVVLDSKVGGVAGTTKINLSGAATVSIVANISDIRRNRNYTGTGTSTNVTAGIPLDNTIPQITEGTEILTATITPTTTTSRIRVTVHVWGTAASACCATSGSAMALFRDAVANALAASGAQAPAGVVGFHMQQHSLVFEEVPGTSSSITYRVRVGASSAFRVNGFNTAAAFGGVGHSSITVEEIAD
jgi:hypothetical protein